MLSTFVQRQKFWVIPMMVSLALSWCLLFCGQLFAEHHPAEAQSDAPPCHSVLSTTATAELLPNHDLCSGCALDAVTSSGLELPPVVLWQEPVSELTLNELPVEQAGLYLAQGPPYPRTTPLYLEKSLLLI